MNIEGPKDVWLRVADLKIDPTYQRRVKQPAVDDMVAMGWRSELAGVLDVSRRESDEMVVIDGQHRVIVARALGVEFVRAIIHEGLSLEDEASLWVDLNTRRSRPKVIDIFNARLVSNDGVALAVRSVIDEAGCFVPRHSGSTPWPGIQAVDACERVFRAGGRPLLLTTLRVLTTAWPEDSFGLRAYLIFGVAATHHFYASHPYYSLEKLIDRLARVPARYVYQRGLELATGGEGGAGNVALAFPGHRRAVVAVFNKGAQKTLPADLSVADLRAISAGSAPWDITR